LDRPGDEGLDLFRREARRLGLHVDLRRRELRKRVIARLAEAVAPVSDEQAEQRDNDAAEAQRETDDEGLQAGEAHHLWAVLHLSRSALSRHVPLRRNIIPKNRHSRRKPGMPMFGWYRHR